MSERKTDGGCQHHADGDRFAMDQLTVTAERFKGMAKRVAVIENRTQTGLFFVTLNNPGLQLTAALYDLNQTALFHRLQFIPAGLKEREKVSIKDSAVLDHLGHAGPKFSPGQRGQSCDVNQHQAGLIKGPDQVLAARVINGGLAADAAVNLRKKSCRHLHERNSAQIGGCGITGEISDNATAQSNQERRTIDFCLNQPVIDRAKRRRVLVLFTVRNLDQYRRYGGGGKGFKSGGSVKRRNSRVTDNRRPSGKPGCPASAAKLFQATRLDQNIVAVISQIDPNHAHAGNFLNLSIISAATSSTDFPFVSILISASA